MCYTEKAVITITQTSSNTTKTRTILWTAYTGKLYMTLTAEHTIFITVKLSNVFNSKCFICRRENNSVSYCWVITA